MPLDPSSSAGAAECPNCGAPLPAQAPQGLCPKCLFAGLAAPTEDGAGAAAAAPHSPEELALHFPQLEILECLGRGGMGVVYKARQTSLGRLVALKLLAPERVSDAKFAERFAQEAKALAALNHPNIVTIHDFGQAGGFYFLLMEFVDGVNLRQAMKAGRFTPEQALAVVPPVCEALQYAHEHGIVHRDIKPENLLLDKDGRVKIADFGVAKMLGEQDGAVNAAESQPAGTPQYMAPEQKDHRRTDHRADIYSLGVVLYELLTGELPADKLQPPSRKVQIDVRLDEIVLRALEVKPELRFQTAGEFRTQVETMIGGASAPPVEPHREASPSRFSRKAIVGACLVAMGLLSFFLALFVDRIAPRPMMPDGGILPSHQVTPAAPALFGAGLLYLFVAALLGWISVTQIRRSAGRLHGMWLAVFDGSLAPLAGLVWLIALFWWWLFRGVLQPAILEERRPLSLMERIFVDHTGAFMVLATCVTALLAGFFIVRAVWRAVNGPATCDGECVPENSGGGAGANLPPSTPQVRPRFKYAGLLVLLMPVLLVAILFVKFFAEARSPSGVTSFDVKPVEVRDNIVLVDVTTEVARGNAELRSMLNGSRLPAATEAALQETSFSPFAVVLIKPTPNDGNPAWRILSPGRQMWRLGFALPDAALAKEAFANLRPIDPQSAKSDLTFAGTLFEVSQPGGETYRASLEVGPALSSGNPRWVEVIGHSQQDASTVTLSWEVFASQPGLAQFSRAGSPIMVLKRQPQTELYSVTAGLELTRLDADRVLFVRHIGYHTLREELSGDFRELTDELLRTKTTSAKTACGTTIELCQFQGKPFTVQVQSTASPFSNGSRTGVFGIGTMAVGAALLLIVAVTGIVLLIVFARIGGPAGKIVLYVVGAMLLLLAVAFAVIVAVRSMSQDSEQTATPVQLPQSVQSSDDPGAVPLEKSPPDARVRPKPQPEQR